MILAVLSNNAYVGIVDKSDRMVNSYGIARRTWKWTKKLFLHLTGIILDAFLIHKYSGGKMTHKVFGSLFFGIWSSIRMKEMWQLVAFPSFQIATDLYFIIINPLP